MPMSTVLIPERRLTMLFLSGFELCFRWVSLKCNDGLTQTSGGSSGRARGAAPTPLFLDPTEASKGPKKYFWRPSLSKGLDDRPPPPPLLQMNRNQFCFIACFLEKHKTLRIRVFRRKVGILHSWRKRNAKAL